ncbi:hypothetical protein [Aquibacillus halophilus]
MQRGSSIMSYDLSLVVFYLDESYEQLDR